MQNLELKLNGDISVQCNNDIDCPIGLICKKNTCRKPGPVPIGIKKGIHTEFPKIYILLLTNWSDNTLFFMTLLKVSESQIIYFLTTDF